jgi:pimeloyl-ACP methyl ester carboxylesterase
MGSVPGEVPLAFGRVGEGPEPLLALHGISNRHRVFGGVARNLSHVDGLVALDLRGRGDSAKPPLGSYGLDAHAGDVIRTLNFSE